MNYKNNKPIKASFNLIIFSLIDQIAKADGISRASFLRRAAGYYIWERRRNEQRKAKRKGLPINVNFTLPDKTMKEVRKIWEKEFKSRDLARLNYERNCKADRKKTNSKQGGMT